MFWLILTHPLLLRLLLRWQFHDDAVQRYGQALFVVVGLLGGCADDLQGIPRHVSRLVTRHLGSRPVRNMPYDPHARFEIDSLVEVAREALSEKASFDTNLNDDKKQAIAEILRLGTSAGGQRAKAIIAYNKATGEVRSGQVEAPAGFDYYLIKLGGVSAKAGFKETENHGRLDLTITRGRTCWSLRFKTTSRMLPRLSTKSWRPSMTTKTLPGKEFLGAST